MISKSSEAASTLSHRFNFQPLAAIARVVVFGCWHNQMSKPFGRDGKNYRDCLECGARRDLDADLKMVGPYYFTTGEKHERN